MLARGGESINYKDHRFYYIFVNLFRLLLLGAVIASIVTANWLNLFISTLTLALTYLPYVLEEVNHIYMPPFLQLLMLIFIFASLYLGELQQYYLKFWWWDVMLHTLSGVVLGVVGFILVYTLNQDTKVNVVLSPLFISIFSVTFAVTVGVLWEIFEFSMDSIFALNMQKSGLVDTMWDLIVDFLGALTTSIMGYIYSRKKGVSYLRRLIRRVIFEEDNTNIDV